VSAFRPILAPSLLFLLVRLPVTHPGAFVPRPFVFPLTVPQELLVSWLSWRSKRSVGSLLSFGVLVSGPCCAVTAVLFVVFWSPSHPGGKMRRVAVAHSPLR